ncbi:MAG: glycoside hydrolase family 97 N-terminal domain-containing protein, partial [Cyclobacteriaceae bacterium]|nr:glycoside hydrolase family 97 N-terminal domain-containing protein [Cyclobacteriaceae bacterium]
MRRIILLITLLAVAAHAGRSQSYQVSSPGRTVSLTVRLDAAGSPQYAVQYKKRPVILPSSLGLQLKEHDLTRGLRVAGADSTVVDETWTPVWGESSSIRNHYRQLTVHLVRPGDKPVYLDLVFRVFDDGVGFRYGLPSQKDMTHFIVSGETSGFQLTGDHTAFWIPGDFDTNEYVYTTSRLSQVDAGAMATKSTEIGTRYVKDSSSVQTPLMMKTSDGLYINLHEAALANYPAMQLHVDRQKSALSSNLVPDAVGNMAYAQTPFQTPWRTIIVAEKATDILASRMILNLNEPCAIPETSWIKPQKMVGVWWEIHVGKGSWDYTYPVNVGPNPDWKTIKPHGMHRATTANTKMYIDFAARHGFQGVLVEGWNVGWEDWFGKWKEDVFDFVTPYPDFDVSELQKYAASKGVKMIMHHETSASVTNYERRLDEAFRFMKTYGYDAVKTGYVGRIIPRGEWHEGQWMINHYNRVAAKAAEFQIMVDSHESTRLTGMHRTYPNWLAAEAARGNEFNAWSIGNPP